MAIVAKTETCSLCKLYSFPYFINYNTIWFFLQSVTIFHLRHYSFKTFVRADEIISPFNTIFLRMASFCDFQLRQIVSFSENFI